MLKNAPLSGEFPITQAFGDNPDAYSDIRCGGLALRGHNGIDYAAPAGTPVFAVQDGVVLSTGDEPDGFGNFVLLGHSWGQTLYAHLDRVTVGLGQQIGGGDQLGLSGNTGKSAAPHLHFGMRIHPFSVADGWCGYSDPKPYLDRLTIPRGAIIGPHIIGGIPHHLEMLSRWQPRMVLVLDPNPDEIRLLRQACPTTVIIGRCFATDQDIDQRIRENPQDAAQWAHEKCMARMTPDVDYWQIANEVLVKEDDLPLLNEFELERMRLAEANGYKCAIFGFSVGNPDLPEDDRMAHWRLVYPAIEQAEEGGHCISLHQYGMPDIWGPDDLYDWLIYRMEHQILRRLPYKKVQFAVTEYGIDGRIQGVNAGWQQYATAEEYTDQLLKSGAYVERFSGRVLGYAVFTLGSFAPWETYDIAGDVANMLADRSQRGTWDDVDTTVNGFTPEDGDTTIAPGDGGSAITPPPNGGTGGTGEGDGAVTIEQRVTDWFDHYNMNIRPLDERPDNPDPDGDIVYILKDVFTTYLGSWEPSDEPGSTPAWAKDDYLKPEFLEAGADHHLMAAVLDAHGNLIKQQKIRFWSDGFDRLEDPDYDAYTVLDSNPDSGWVNHALYPGSSFAPERGESGPWCWAPEGAADVICGGGLPARHHLSTFAVWQAIPRAEYENNEGDPGGEIGEPITDPGGEIGEPITDPGGEIGEPITDPGGEIIETVERRISPQAVAMNMSIHSIAERPDNPDPDGDKIYVIKDVFTTRNGSWEPSDEFGSIPQWARDEYLKPWGAPDYFDDAGADRHLFIAVIGADGEMIRQQPVMFWSDGFSMLGDPDYNDYVRRETKEHSGWINIPIGPGSNFVPERGESGPWCWTPEGAAEVFCGGGLPAKQHVSTFVVWQELPSDAVVTDPGMGGGEITEPGSGEPGETVDETTFERRLSDWVEPLNISIKTRDERPDNPDPNSEIVFLIKDIFTTINGSWEPSDEFASVPQWARDDYLKPWGAPDYFDDAGADHHLFAAVIGLDGELMGEQGVRYWSDGFDKLGDPDYDGYVHRQTKDHSGWINIPMGPSSSYVPERGESGPWSWMPNGDSEVVVGGGMPAKQHVSTFVVWQAVRRADIEGGQGGDGGDGNDNDHNIFMPIVMGAPQASQAPDSANDAPEEVESAAAPPSTPGLPPQIDFMRMRNIMWTDIGLKPRANTPIARYARSRKLGMPVTQQVTAGDYLMQGFDGGIVYVNRKTEERIGHIDW